MNEPLFNQEEIAVIRALQVDMPLVPEPYEQIAAQIGMSEERLLKIMESLHQRGCLKRMSIALRHNNVGYTVNVMTVWDVSEERMAEVGKQVAQNPQVTHCYTRNRLPEFDYNFYAMVHAVTEEDYEQLMATLEAMIKPRKYSALRTTAELKKIGMKYFVEDPYGGLA